MKSLLYIIVFLLCFQYTNAQADKNGNPVFNSTKLEDQNLGDITISSGYYTIKNNISDKSSSVYMNENPTVSDYFTFATKLPSYFFVVHRKTEGLAMMMLLQKQDKSYFYNVVIPATKENFQVPSSLIGDITEHRASELMTLSPFQNTNVYIQDNREYYNYDGNKYLILKHKILQEEIKKIVAEKIINRKVETENSNDLEAEIIKESIGGKLDFSKQIESYSGSFIAYENIMYNKKDFGILMWGAAVSKMGLKDFEKAKVLWEKIFKRTLTEPEIKALKKGQEYK